MIEWRTVFAAVAVIAMPLGVIAGGGMFSKYLERRQVPTPVPLEIYSASWCEPCKRLNKRLSERGVYLFTVKQDGPRQTVYPTVEWSDGTTSTEPLLWKRGNMPTKMTWREVE